MEKQAFFPAATQKAPEVIYSQIYQRIMSGELKPGDRLPPERILAEQFQRSRHIIREAIRMLQQDGLVRVEVGSGGGTVIQGVSLDSIEAPLKKFLLCGILELEELIEYRQINDHGCAKLAAIHHTAEDISALERILEQAKESIDDVAQFSQHDVAFHNALAAASHNRLAIMVNNAIVGLNTTVMGEAIREYSHQERAALNRRVYETHYAIFAAVRSGDPVAADRGVDEMVDLFRAQFQ